MPTEKPEELVARVRAQAEKDLARETVDPEDSFMMDGFGGNIDDAFWGGTYLEKKESAPLRKILADRLGEALDIIGELRAYPDDLHVKQRAKAFLNGDGKERDE